MSSNNFDAIFKALADKNRRKILDLIKDKPLNTGEICTKFKDLDRCTVMLHLKVLENSELIIVKREGRYRWNYINVVPIQKIYNRWIKQYSSFSADILSELQGL